jgi:C1A family cysteine protease
MHRTSLRHAGGETGSSEKRHARLHAVSLVAGCSLAAAIAGISPAAAQAPDPPGTTYGMGLLPASPDQIAHFPKAPELKAAGIPKKVDLSAFFPPVGNQGRQGSCVAWSIGYGMRSYYVAKMDKLNVSQPQNMQVDRALDILKGGVVSLAELPYDATKCSPPPDIEMQKKATKFRIQAWQFIHPSKIGQIKAQLADGQPIVFATKLANSFMDFRGGVYSRKEREQLLDGGHAMVLIGYDDDRRAFRLQNSWGTGWGDQGRAWVSYDTFHTTDPNGPGDAGEAYVVYAGPAFQ